MTLILRAAALSFLALPIASPTSAFDGRELLAAWKARADAEGGTLSIGGQSESPDGLALAEIEVSYVEDGETITATLDRMTLRETVEGSVGITVPGDQSMVYSRAIPNQAPARATFTLRGALEIVASGDLPLPDYAFSASGFGAELTQFEGPDVDVDADFRLALTDLSGTAPGRPGATTVIDIAALALSAAFTDQTRQTSSAIEGTYSDLKGEIIPPALGVAPSVAEASATLSFGPSRTEIVQTAPGVGRTETEVAQQSATLDLTLAKGMARYESSAREMDVRLSADGLPVNPLDFGVARTDMVLAAPLGESGGETRAHLTGSLSDIVLTPEVWNKLDPAQALPRDPAQIRLDLVGDLASFKLPEGAGADSALLPTGIEINELLVEAAGTTLDLSGAFDFPTDNPLNLPDMIQPVGKATISATGAMALLQRLVTAGLLSGEQSMGAQMMLGMFATQAEDGSLTSTIVTEPGGGLIVNGNRMK